MANTVVVKVKVEELTKYGFKSNGKYVNYSKQLSEKDKAMVVPGAELDAEYYVADSGKEYLNKILSVVVPVLSYSGPEAVSTAPKAKKSFVKADSMTKAEWSAKDRSQLIGGLSHDAATLVAAVLGFNNPDGTTEGMLEMYKQVLTGLIKIRDEIK
jgi:hypothetical protein